MKYRTLHIRSSAKTRASVLIIYSGGTIGMDWDSSGSLVALKFNQIMQQLPSLSSLEVEITVISFQNPIDSSEMNIGNWLEIGRIIYENYQKFDGFVVLQGTDTMAYTASALSFALEGLNKPVILTGAQLPISAIRSDARTNLITAIEIATLKNDNRAVVPEVCIYFDNQLLRGNRTTKVKSSQFSAFESMNYPPLAQVGIHIDFNYPALLQRKEKEKLVFHPAFDQNIAILKIFPSMRREIVETLAGIPDLKGLILETFGSGNAPTGEWLINPLKKAIREGITLLNVSQCIGGMVMHGRYATSRQLEEIGVISGGDMTIEAAVTKMMLLFGVENNINSIKKKLSAPICGEMSEA